MQENIVRYRILNIKKETEDVSTLTLSSDGPFLTHIAGQIVTIYFEDKGKEYSISSAPSENCVNLTVKKVGTFSELITNKKVGDILLGSQPYGYFYTESVDTDLIFVAGGVGVAPFRSMIVQNLHLNPKRKIHLFYSNKKLKDFIFKSEFDDLALKYKNYFNVYYYLTKDISCGENIKFGRIATSDILEKNNSNKAEFFICGSMDFVRSYHNLLCLGGIPESSIFTEEFF